MADATDHGASRLQAVATAMVRLHKEQFGRGPTNARAFFAGPDALICVLDDALLPAERRMVEHGNADRVRDTRIAFQAATYDDFVAAVEEILGRRVRAFASAIDPQNGTVFENFTFHPDGAGE